MEKIRWRGRESEQLMLFMKDGHRGKGSLWGEFDSNTKSKDQSWYGGGNLWPQDPANVWAYLTADLSPATQSLGRPHLIGPHPRISRGDSIVNSEIRLIGIDSDWCMNRRAELHFPPRSSGTIIITSLHLLFFLCSSLSPGGARASKIWSNNQNYQNFGSWIRK